MKYTHEYEPRIVHTGIIPSMPSIDTSLDSIMTNYLLSRALSTILARYNQWYPSSNAGDNIPRIIIPATNTSGTPFWQARALVPCDKRYQSPHSPREDSVIVVWPLFTGARRDHSLVVEGPMDALAGAEFGFIGVALMGNTPPMVSLALTSRLIRGTMCTIVPDRDSSGSLSSVLSYLAGQGVSCRLLQLPSEYKDLSDMPIELRGAFLAL